MSVPTDSALVTVNQTNIVAGTNNTALRYNFPSGTVITRKRICVNQLAMYYSWANVTSVLNNNFFQINHPLGTSAISNFQITGTNLITVTVASTAQFITGKSATLIGLTTNTGYNNFTGIVTVVNGTTFTMPTTGAVNVNTAETGTATSFQTIDITLPDGFYDVPYLNFIIQSTLASLKLYLIDNNGNNQYYIALNTNPIRYRCQLNIIPLPTSLPTGWSIPAGSPLALSSINVNPQLVLSQLGFDQLIGFTPLTSLDTSPQYYPVNGTLGNSTGGGVVTGSIYSSIGSTTPQLTPPSQSSIYLNCDQILNKTTNNKVLLQITPTVGYGSQFVINPQFPVWVSLNDAGLTQLDFYFTDNTGAKVLNILDPAMSLMTIIADKDETTPTL